MAPSGRATHHKDSRSKRLPSRAGRLPAASLAALLEQHPACCDGKKIAAVDRGLASLDHPLPQRYLDINALYVSRNGLRSLAGVQQFRGLRALAATGNALPDPGCLRTLTDAGLALEAAAFEGNPMAQLPNYRAHVIHTLGPSLATLDGRPVGEQERRGAAAAVAHEAAMLASMCSSACLVHKLGRTVQLARLHRELLARPPVVAAAGGEGLQRGSGRSASRVAQLWDYEAGLDAQERGAIGLAIRREVARRHRKLALASDRPDGELWPQAFAQVMLLQQDAIAGLLGMLEAAEEEGAATLGAFPCPASPVKHAALQGEQQAPGRARQDRATAFQQLQGACLALADAAVLAGAPQLGPQLGARIRQLQVELLQAGAEDAAQQAANARVEEGGEAAAAGRWSIAAVRTALAGGVGAAATQPASAERRGAERSRGGMLGPCQGACEEQHGGAHAASIQAQADRLPTASAAAEADTPLPGMAQCEAAVAEQRTAAQQLAVALREAQQHARRLDVQLADQREATAEAQAAAACQDQRRARQLAELGGQLEAALASRATLRCQLEAAAEERRRLAHQAQLELEQAAGEARRLAEAACAGREAEAQRAQRLEARIAELEGRGAVELRLTVASHEEEWRAEAVRGAALAARARELQQQVAAFQRQQRLGSASSALASRAILRRAMMRWLEAAAEAARLRALQQTAALLRRRSLLACWLHRWRLAAQRSVLLGEWRQRRQLRALRQVWQTWRGRCQERLLMRGLEAAAQMHRQRTVLRQYLWAWGGHIAACRQVELPQHHPAVGAAAELQRSRLLRSFFGAWRQHMAEQVLPRQAQVQMRLLQHWMGSQRLAFQAWQAYIERRRRAQHVRALAAQHQQRQLLARWRRFAQEGRQHRGALLRGDLASQTLLLRRSCRAWRARLQERRHKQQQLARAEQHCGGAVLAGCWRGWRERVLLHRAVAQRCAAQRLASALGAWRAAVEAAKHKRLADAFLVRCGRRRCRATLEAWGAAAAARRQRRAQAARGQQQLLRRLLGRALGEWRRAALAGRLHAALGLVAQLHGDVQQASGDLQGRASEVDALRAGLLQGQGERDGLSGQADSLRAKLAAAQRQLAELQTGVHEAQQQLSGAADVARRALAAQAAAEAAQAAAQARSDVAKAQRDGAVACKRQAEAARAAACIERQEAELGAAYGAAAAAAAADAAGAALARATAAAAALHELRTQHQQAREQLQQAGKAQQAIAADLQRARDEAQRAVDLLTGLQAECGRLQRKREEAERSSTCAAEERQAALQQAERLAALCEAREQRCGRLQRELARLQEPLASHGALQKQLSAMSLPARVGRHD